MPSAYTREIKLWAKLLISAVTVARRLTGTTFGACLIGFALAHGFTWAPKPTVPDSRNV